MNSTNYVAFSFAALFDRPSVRAAPRRVITQRREEESYQTWNNGDNVSRVMSKLEGMSEQVMTILYNIAYILYLHS